jgi:hypothetical protein
LHRRDVVLVGLAVVYAGQSAHAQSVPVRKLGAPIATYDHEFTGIDGVRELSSGRLIAIDGRDKAIHFIEADLQAGRKIGRDGDGPGEFRLPMKIFGIGGDTSLVEDFARGARYLVITGDGKFGPLIATKDSAYDIMRATKAWATDARGGFYYALMGASMFDSMTIMRWDRRQRRDSLGRYDPETKSPLYKERPEVRTGPGGMMSFRPKVIPFTTADQWAVSADGRIAIVTVQPYRVRIRNTNGTVVTGPVRSYQPVAVTAAEKAEHLKEIAKPTAGIWYGRNGATSEASYRKPLDWMIAEMTPKEWPESYPAFPRQALLFASDGTLWVRRYVRSGAPSVYDVFDQAGRIAYQIELPPRTSLVGFGAGVVYLSRTDDDDLQYLERYKLPAR